MIVKNNLNVYHKSQEDAQGPGMEENPGTEALRPDEETEMFT